MMLHTVVPPEMIWCEPVEDQALLPDGAACWKALPDGHGFVEILERENGKIELLRFVSTNPNAYLPGRES